MGTIGTVIFVVCYLFMLLINDVIVRLYYIINSERAHSYYTRLIKYFAAMTFAFPKLYTNFQIQIENTLSDTLPKVFIIISNHQSLFDIPALIHCFPRHNLKFIAKMNLRRGLPMISFGLRMGKHATINRTGDFSTTYKTLTKISKLSTQKFCPVVFPEGTRSRNGKVLRFHSAAFRLLIEDTHLPVVSVAVDGGYNIASLTTLFSNLKNAKYYIKTLNIYPFPQGKHAEIELLRTIKAEIEDQLTWWRRSEK